MNMATVAGVNLLTPRVHAGAPRVQMMRARQPWKRSSKMDRLVYVCAAPEKISEKVEESIKNAQETCSDDPASGECVAAWDEVEELSAAASHARDKTKASDPLEEFCKDNPETDECRTYDD